MLTRAERQRGGYRVERRSQVFEPIDACIEEDVRRPHTRVSFFFKGQSVGAMFILDLVVAHSCRKRKRESLGIVRQTRGNSRRCRERWGG